MKKKYILMTLLAAFALTSCNLDLFPETDYNEGNVQTSGESSTESQYSTREDMEGLKEEILKAVQNLFQSDFIYKVSISGVKYG